MEKLNTSTVFAAAGSVTDIISGASLSGLVGAVSPSPKVVVNSVAVNLGTSRTLTLYKGVSGGSDPLTQLLVLNSSGNFNVPLGIVLEAGEYLTAAASAAGGSFTGFYIIVSADITF